MVHSCTRAQGLISIQFQPRNQNPQAGIGLHFITIVISESRQLKSSNKKQLFLLVNLIHKSLFLILKNFKNTKTLKIENQKLKNENQKLKIEVIIIYCNRLC